MKHCVYYIFDLDEEILLYVGRSIEPEARLQGFMYRESISAVLGKVTVCDSFEAACSLELAEIQRLRPPYNKWMASNAGFLGRKHSPASRRKISESLRGRVCTPEARAKQSETVRGRVKSPEHRAKIAASLRGKPGHPLSAEARAKISASKIGKPRSAETRAKMSATIRAKQLTKAHA